MAYFDSLLQRLKHDKIDVDDNILKYCLWYSCNSQAYIQRTDKFDGSFLYSHDSDDYVAALIISIFRLDYLENFIKQDDCDQFVRSLDLESLDQSFMCIYCNSSSLFFDFYEKIRNSFAHGQFNLYHEINYFLGQGKAKPDKPINFLLQTRCDISQQMNELIGYMNLALEDEFHFKVLALKDFLQLDYSESIADYRIIKCYSNKYHLNVIFDNTFSFDSSNHREEINNLLEKYYDSQKTVIIVSEDLKNYKLRNLSINEGTTQLLDSSRILDYFYSI